MTIIAKLKMWWHLRRGICYRGCSVVIYRCDRFNESMRPTVPDDLPKKEAASKAAPDAYVQQTPKD